MSEGNDGSDKERIAFDSKNIGNQPKAEYFVEVRKRFSLQKLYKSIDRVAFLKGWRKFAILGGVIALTVATIIVITIVNKPIPEEPQTFNPAQTANDAYYEAVDILQGTSDQAYFESLTVFDEAIAEAQSNSETKNELLISKAKFHQAYGDKQEAISILLKLKADTEITETQTATTLILLASLYGALGNNDKAAEMQTEYNNKFGGGL